jgi:ribose/xylose/arabinose/galactoside ABC-type transport system permease subunit
LLRSDAFVPMLCAVYALAVATFTPGFVSAENALNVLSNMLPLLIVAAGQTVVVVTGGIDLSVTSTIAMASTLGALAMTSWDSSLAGIAVMLALGIGIGLLNGAAIAALRMPPFIVTLTTMMFFSGFAIWTTKSNSVPGLPRSFTAGGTDILLVLPLAAATVAAAQLLLTRTRFGQWLYAAGRSQKTAVASGVPVGRTIAGAYAISGCFAAIAGALYTARLETGSPVLGQRILLDVIAAVVIGGTSLFGGRGSVLWTVWGVLFITLVDNSLNLLGVSNFTVLFAKGIVILLAALLDTVRTRYAAAV